MNLIEKVKGFCEIQNQQVEILMIKVKKGKSKEETRTPVRCQNAGSCQRGSFCRFVNPLTTRLPVDFSDETKRPQSPAAAS